MEDAKPTFDLAVINPDIIIGPLLQFVSKPSAINETNTFAVNNFINGVYTQVEEIQFPFYHFVSRALISSSVITIKLMYNRSMFVMLPEHTYSPWSLQLLQAKESSLLAD
jgi:hypothetical protein